MFFVERRQQLRAARLPVQLLSAVRHRGMLRRGGREVGRPVLRLRRRVQRGQGGRPEGVLLLRGEGLAHGPERILAVHIPDGTPVSRKLHYISHPPLFFFCFFFFAPPLKRV